MAISEIFLALASLAASSASSSRLERMDEEEAHSLLRRFGIDPEAKWKWPEIHSESLYWVDEHEGRRGHWARDDSFYDEGTELTSAFTKPLKYAASDDINVCLYGIDIADRLLKLAEDEPIGRLMDDFECVSYVFPRSYALATDPERSPSDPPVYFIPYDAISIGSIESDVRWELIDLHGEAVEYERQDLEVPSDLLDRIERVGLRRGALKLIRSGSTVSEDAIGVFCLAFPERCDELRSSVVRQPQPPEMSYAVRRLLRIERDLLVSRLEVELREYEEEMDRAFGILASGLEGTLHAGAFSADDVKDPGTWRKSWRIRLPWYGDIEFFGSFFMYDGFPWMRTSVVNTVSGKQMCVEPNVDGYGFMHAFGTELLDMIFEGDDFGPMFEGSSEGLCT
jgi:hypothetical protein